MLTLSPDFEDKLLQSLTEALKDVGKDGTTLVAQIVSAVTAVTRQFFHSVDSDCTLRLDQANSQINDLQDKLYRVDKDLESNCRNFEKLRYKQDEKVDLLTQKVDQLSNKVTQLEHHHRSSEIDRVKNNVIVKTRKSSGEIGDYLVDMIKKGCGEKPSMHLLSIHQIIQKKSFVTPGKPKKGKTAESHLYKVSLSAKMKSDLFKGLALPGNRSNSDFQVSHDTPRFLVKQKQAYEKIGFSIRSSFKGQVKTRISLKSHNLCMMIKVGDADWIDLTSDSKYLDTPLVLSQSDNVPKGVKTVDDLRKTIHKF